MHQYIFTRHSEWKMKYYRLSKQKVLSVIRRPDRVEEGIVEKTTAVMQAVSPKLEGGGKKWKQEIWVMYQVKIKNEKSKIKTTGQNEKIKKLRNQINSDKHIRIISAWRYPGMSPKNRPIPEAILAEALDAEAVDLVSSHA